MHLNSKLFLYFKVKWNFASVAWHTPSIHSPVYPHRPLLLLQRRDRMRRNGNGPLKRPARQAEEERSQVCYFYLSGRILYQILLFTPTMSHPGAFFSDTHTQASRQANDHEGSGVKWGNCLEESFNRMLWTTTTTTKVKIQAPNKSHNSRSPFKMFIRLRIGRMGSKGAIHSIHPRNSMPRYELCVGIPRGVGVGGWINGYVVRSLKIKIQFPMVFGWQFNSRFYFK